MFRSQNFLAQEQHLHKTLTPGSDEYRVALHDLMKRHLRQFPESLVSDLLDYMIPEEDDPAQTAIRIADSIDLLWMQYDDQNDPFTPDDWRYMRDIVDAYAVELDMALVQYIMERVVDHGALE